MCIIFSFPSQMCVYIFQLSKLRILFFHLQHNRWGDIIDAVRLFAAAVRELDATEEIETEKIDCQDPQQWQHGKRIAEYMRLVSLLLILLGIKNLFFQTQIPQHSERTLASLAG